jgi:hypothetical protein
MKPAEYVTYLKDFIFVACNLSAIALATAEESGQKNPFAGTRCGIAWYYTTHDPQDQV